MVKKILLFCLFFITGGLFVIVLGITKLTNTGLSDNHPINQVKQKISKFLDPDIETKDYNLEENLKTQEVKDAIGEMVKKKYGKDKIIRYSVYFINLTHSNWFGINEREGFIPGSLLKTFLMTAYFEQSEKKP